jgi:hypothetical protein
VLTERLFINQPDDFPELFFDALFLNIFVTGVFTIVYSFPAHRLLPDTYYSIHNPKLLTRVGKIIQMDLFKKLLTKTIWRERNNKKYFFNGFRGGIDNLEVAARQSEFGHFMGFCVVMSLAVFFAIKTSFLIAVMIFVVNIFFNFYPFMLQRFHRLRVNKVKSKKAA